MYEKLCRLEEVSENFRNRVLRMLVGYMRVSSEGDRQATNLQRDALLKAGVDARNIFEDKASGARDKRQGLTNALNFLQNGDCFVVWKLDRLGRSLSNLLDIMSTLHIRGVAFRSLTEQMDTTTPHGELFFSLFGALAQYERALTRERIMAGLEAAKKRGGVMEGGLELLMKEKWKLFRRQLRQVQVKPPYVGILG